MGLDPLQDPDSGSSFEQVIERIEIKIDKKFYRAFFNSSINSLLISFFKILLPVNAKLVKENMKAIIVINNESIGIVISPIDVK